MNRAPTPAETQALAERTLFELDYEMLYPRACRERPEVFETNAEGDYLQSLIRVDFQLWRAGYARGKQ